MGTSAPAVNASYSVGAYRPNCGMTRIDTFHRIACERSLYGIVAAIMRTCRRGTATVPTK